MTQKLDKIQRARDNYLQLHGSTPSTDDLASAAGIGVGEVERLMRVQRQPLSFDDPPSRQGTRTLEEMVADSRQTCPDDHIDQHRLEHRIEDVLGNLDIRERQVLQMRVRPVRTASLEPGRHRQGAAREQGADPAD